MNSEPGRDSLDASDPELVLPANLLEQLHLSSPLHPGLLPHQQDASVKKGGPIYSIEVGRFRVSKSMAARDAFFSQEIKDPETLSRSITVAATGRRAPGKPSISIADNGEGQTPSSVPRT